MTMPTICRRWAVYGADDTPQTGPAGTTVRSLQPSCAMCTEPGAADLAKRMRGLGFHDSSTPLCTAQHLRTAHLYAPKCASADRRKVALLRNLPMTWPLAS